MRRIKNYNISKESFDDMCRAKRFNQCLEITFRDKIGKHTHKISAGYSDDINVYRKYDETFVLSQNTRLGYVGLEIFKGNSQTGDIFLENESMMTILGRDDLAPFTIIRRLMKYINP